MMTHDLQCIVFIMVSMAVYTVTTKATCKEKINGSIYTCGVNLPQHETQQQCVMERDMSTKLAQSYYVLTNPQPSDELTSPSFDQPDDVVGLVARLDELDSSWFSIYYTMITALNMTAQGLKELTLAKGIKLSTYRDYKFFYDQFHATITQKLGQAAKWFRQPTSDPNFLDITINDTWRNDQYFTQRRLAGQCAYHLRLVNDKYDETKPIGMDHNLLTDHLNQDFDWDAQLSIIKNKQTTLEKAISESTVFVLYHEDYNDLPRTEDIASPTPNDKHDKTKLLESPSPITLFMLNKEGELEVVAIQLGHTPDSHVITPNPYDPFDLEWMRAKGFVEISEMAVCQLSGHLVATHRTQEILCNLFRRSLSLRHPLSQLMTIHCQGTTPVGHLGVSSLVDEYRYMHKLFDIGHLGTQELINRAYAKQDYTDSDLPIVMKEKGTSQDVDVKNKRQGLDSKEIKYYPYRDDGLVIWKQIENFAKKYVKIYYKTDEEVRRDFELEAFVNEVSYDGNYAYGGKYKGFPVRFQTQSDVSTFITRFIWLVVLHAANSYPLLPYGTYLPIMPTKLYDDDAESYAHMLPDLDVTLHQEVLSFTLSGFRLNRLFTYSKQMADSKARKLVHKTQKVLHTCIQQRLEERNEKRYKKGQLTYQYMEPKHLPNSIHS